MGSLDLPDEPDEPGRVEDAGAGGADRPAPKSREMPDPDERGRVYEAMRVHSSAETGEPAERGRPPDQAERGSYWAEVPRFRGLWAHHERCWPERQSAEPDRPADPPGSYRSKGGFELNPERHTETVEAIGRMRKAEPSISADMQAIEKGNPCGGWLAGFDRRLKGDDRLKEKIAEKLEAESRTPTARALGEIGDAIRFTYCFQPESYTQGYYDIKAQLESFGHEMYFSKNWWTNPEYKGINTRWVTQEGQRFEVQFHTPESFHAKHYVTHCAYERIRDLATRDEERGELKVFQREASSWIRVPVGAADIPGYRKEGF